MKEGFVGTKTYQAPEKSGFGTNAEKKIHKPDPVQLPTLQNPGVGTYTLDKHSTLPSARNWDKGTWPLMSQT